MLYYFLKISNLSLNYIFSWIYPIQKPETGWIAYAFYPGFIVLYIGIFFLGMLLESGLSRLISSKRVMEPTVFKEYETI